jgi:hypothetical protein
MLWNVESDKSIIATEMREMEGMKNYLGKSALKGLTADCVRRKIKIMKAVYSQELNKIMKSEKSVAGTNGVEQSLEKGKNWLNKIKQDLKGLGMGDVWIMGEESNRNVWREVSKRCMDIERQNMGASMKEKRSLVFYNELKK